MSGTGCGSGSAARGVRDRQHCPGGLPLYLVGFIGGEAVALEEIGGLGCHLVEEDSGVTLGTKQDRRVHGGSHRTVGAL